MISLMNIIHQFCQLNVLYELFHIIHAPPFYTSLDFARTTWMSRYQQSIWIVGVSACVIFILHQKIQKMVKCPESCKMVVCVVLLPCLCRFFFFPISSFPLLLQQLPHSTTMFSYACMGLLTIHTDLCSFHHYIFYLSPVFIYLKVFPLCFCYLIFDHALVFFTCLFLLELRYTHCCFILLMPSVCCIKPHVHNLLRYQFMLWCTFFVWNDRFHINILHV